jgi:hypothetical protein
MPGRSRLLSRLPRHAVCAEIGVWKGEFSELILDVAKPRQLHLVDPWLFQPMYPNRWYGGRAAKSQADMDAIHDGVVGRFRNDSRIILHRKKSVDAASEFGDGSLDWVYIDGDHGFEAVTQDLAVWSPKLRPGGYIAGDDFNWQDEKRIFSVRRAVMQFADERELPIHLVRGNQFLIQI